MILGCDLVHAFNTHTILNTQDIPTINHKLTIQDNFSKEKYKNNENQSENLCMKALTSKVIKANKPRKSESFKINKYNKIRYQNQHLNNLKTKSNCQDNHEEKNDESRHLPTDGSDPPIDFINNFRRAPTKERTQNQISNEENQTQINEKETQNQINEEETQSQINDEENQYQISEKETHQETYLTNKRGPILYEAHKEGIIKRVRGINTKHF
jgi:acetyl/propionyl-CoA carboxylase alpha subunit